MKNNLNKFFLTIFFAGIVLTTFVLKDESNSIDRMKLQHLFS
jgi:hypothetical protein